MTNSANKGRLKAVDQVIVWLVAAYGAVATLVLLFGPKLVDPQEDAVILFQYSRNLAQTGAITFITHGPHTEGATDFLWMVMIALGFKLGANPAWLVAVINFVSVLLIAYLLLRLAKVRVRPLYVFFIAGTFAMLPQIYAALTCFSVLPFAALMLLLITFFVERNDPALAATALITCLFRPDGVVFVLPLLVASLWLYEGRGKRLAWIAGLFVLPGIVYFLWRWHYFGERLPLPFLVKADTPRIAHVLVLESLHNAKPLLLFLLPLLVLAFRGQFKDRALRAVALCMLALPLCFYLAMRLDQNVGLRFFVFLFAVPAALIAMRWKDVAPRAPVLLRVGALLWLLVVVPTYVELHREVTLFQPTNRRAIAEQMSALPHGQIIVTEAGALPYYSRWPSYDAWGLNTQQFAHRMFQPDDVGRIHPDIVLLYTYPNAEECVPQAEWQTPYSGRNWQHMTRNIVTGVSQGAYDLLVVPFGSSVWREREGIRSWQGWQECWYVRRDSADHDQVEQILYAHHAETIDDWRGHNLQDARESQPFRPHGLLRVAHGLYYRWLDLVM